jgi:hypothetical protein
MQDPDKIGRIAVALAVSFGTETSWGALPTHKAEAIRAVLNDGIPEAEVILTEAVGGDFVAIAATFRDDEKDFSAEYLLFQDEVVFSYEN